MILFFRNVAILLGDVQTLVKVTLSSSYLLLSAFCDFIEVMRIAFYKSFRTIIVTDWTYAFYPTTIV